jgi:hypothetical protein
MKKSNYKNIYGKSNENPRDMIIRSVVGLVKDINSDLSNKAKVLSKKIVEKSREKTN